MKALAPDRFVMQAEGRSGVISYTDGAHTIDIPWEMSGSSRYDILLAPLDLRRWRIPAGELISHAQQRDILLRLRQWLASRQTRSDVDLPAESQQSSRTCVWHDCQRLSLAGSAYCVEHFDETLLRA
jgi:hypothetical protein